jgi:hypothetical protein
LGSLVSSLALHGPPRLNHEFPMAFSAIQFYRTGAFRAFPSRVRWMSDAASFSRCGRHPIDEGLHVGHVIEFIEICQDAEVEPKELFGELTEWRAKE